MHVLQNLQTFLEASHIIQRSDKGFILEAPVSDRVCGGLSDKGFILEAAVKDRVSAGLSGQVGFLRFPSSLAQ